MVTRKTFGGCGEFAWGYHLTEDLGGIAKHMEAGDGF
jgi:hypothetical protein